MSCWNTNKDPTFVMGLGFGDNAFFGGKKALDGLTGCQAFVAISILFKNVKTQSCGSSSDSTLMMYTTLYRFKEGFRHN